MESPVTVHVLSDDQRVVHAARSLAPRFNVTFSENRQEALETMEREGADVAIVELELGGFGVVKDIRGRNSISDARVVMLCDRPHDRWLCKQAGADEVLVKPLSDLSVLAKTVESLLSLS